MRSAVTWHALVLASALATTVGCDGKWPASMEEQPTPKALSASRPAPEGAVPVGGVETVDDREDVQDETNPYANNPALTIKGRRLFATHCAVCHAANGHGGGKLSKKFPPAPDLRYMTICRRSDGFIYGTITAGGRAMPSLREGLTSLDRWALVNHVREIQQEGCLTPEQVSPEAAATLPAGGQP